MGVDRSPAGTLLCREQEVGRVFWFEYLKLGPSQKMGGCHFLFFAAHQQWRIGREFASAAPKTSPD